MKRESDIQNLIKLEASRKGARLWRNNLGAVHTVDGRFIRFGLANESYEINSVIKSADLIGIRPLLITQEMVGQTIGQFLSREVKHSEWKYCGSAIEIAQVKWANLINSLGGDACFAVDEGTL